MGTRGTDEGDDAADPLVRFVEDPLEDLVERPGSGEPTVGGTLALFGKRRALAERRGLADANREGIAAAAGHVVARYAKGAPGDTRELVENGLAFLETAREAGRAARARDDDVDDWLLHEVAEASEERLTAGETVTRTTLRFGEDGDYQDALLLVRSVERARGETTGRDDGHGRGRR